MRFEILGRIESVEVIAVNNAIRDIRRLRRLYGGSRWRKLKGVARIRKIDGEIRKAELHWYEAHGVGRREIRVKRIIEWF